MLAQRTKLALAELQQGFDEVDDFLGRDSTHIVVGALPLVRTFVLPAAIDRMVRNSGRVQIRAVDGRYAELLHGVRHGDIDFLIGALRDPAPVDDIVQEPLFDDPLAIVAGTKHPLAGRDEVTIDDVLAYPWVAPPKNTPAGSYLYDTLRIQDLPSTPVRVVSSSLRAAARFADDGRLHHDYLAQPDPARIRARRSGAAAHRTRRQRPRHRAYLSARTGGRPRPSSNSCPICGK